LNLLSLPTHFEEVAGKGVTAGFEGANYQIGSRKWVGCDVDEEDRGTRKVYISKEGKCIGYFVLADEIRKEAPLVMEKLKSLHIEKIAMLTGDERKSAEFIAKKVGIKTVEAELSPEDKVKKVAEYRKISPYVLMVGDGINDAPALASATVGMAMGAHGTAISAESADIVLLVDDLSRVTDTIAIGQRMLKVAKQSIFVGMGLSFLLMIIALSGKIAPPVGALLQEFIDVVVILNALRAR
jgi:P-type E1-E2 ATPase